jgi:hypothetical protein
MSTRKNSRYIKVAAFVALLSTALYAAITFNPNTQPLVAVGPYALKSDDLSTADNRAYRPWYENGAWQGDLIEYTIDPQGNRTSTADNYTIPIIDFTPVSDFEKGAFAAYGKASLDGVDQNWTARTTFAYQEWRDPYNSLNPYWKQRNIFTWDGTSTVSFEWDNLVTAGMAGDIDQATLDDPLLLDDDPWASPILNYVRGDHRNEKIQPYNGTLRSRYSLLGDIVNANPVYIGPPREIYIDPAFNTFKTDNANRPAVIAIGSNDGMLHVLSEADGSELYAYIPSMLVHKLDRLAVVPPYQHTYYVDGRLTSASAKINDSWTTVLTGGLGAGEKGLFALDVTATDPSSHTVLFEKTEAEGFGYIYGQPSLLRMPGGTWSIFTGNGLGTNNRAQLLVVNLDDESVTAINTLDDTPAGLSEATLIDTNNDQIVDLAFAGDTKGDMWRFSFDPNPAKAVTVTKVFDGSADQPITTGAEVGEHPNGGYMVYWGTGNTTSITDARDTSYPTQAVYGIWDQATGTRIATQTLATAIGETFPNADTGDRTETVRYIDENEFETIQSSNKHFQYICPAADNDCIAIKGWKFELPANERLTGGAPQLRAARLSFVTNNPLGTNTFDDGALNPDLEGDNWLMSLDYLTGGDSVGTQRASVNKGVALNLNGDTLLDEKDMIDGVTPPVGLQLGEGSVSQPTIALLGPSIDMMFINGLELPLPQVEPGGPLFNGHIDVTVDSPLAAGGGSKAPNDIAYMSQGYNIQTNDGLGKAVDGLVHEYSDIHGISYVDLFELEPRRGLTSMDGTPFPPVNGTCPENSTEINDATGALYACVVTSLDAELNRAYDTFTREITNDDVDLDNGTCPADGPSRYGPFYEPVLVDLTLDHCIEWRITPESETYLLGIDKSIIPKDKAFIVTLANADISTAGILQIGCRTWPVEVYQDMITGQLENGTSPGNLVDTVYKLGPGSLLFTLEGIASGAKDNGVQCPDDSPLPTLRVSFEQRSILDLGVHGTRSQCVLGLHQPEDKVCYADAAVLAAAESIIPKIQDGSLVPDDDPTCGGVTDAWGPPPVEEVTVTDDLGNIIDTYYRTYLQDPGQNWHITWNPNVPGEDDLTGFRWRNGALTLQLLDAGSFYNQNCTATAARSTDCPLQHPDSLLKNKNGVRSGGTFAQAFTAKFKGVKLSSEILDRNAKAPNDSGLLYEAVMYWHYGRLADDIRTSAELGSGNPSSTPCYGDPNYSSRLQIEASGANPGEVNRIIDKSITEDELRAYFSALGAVQNCGNDAVACGEALVALATMLALDPDLALLDSILPYVNIDDLDLPPDIGGNVDSTPNRDVTSLDIDVGGKPQFVKSLRRSWIDLRN